MPLIAPVLGSLIFAQLSAKGLVGVKTFQLSQAIGNGVTNYILAAAIYQGVGIGTTPGVGVGTGTIQGIVGPIVGQNIYIQMLAQGLIGAKAMSMASAIGSAFASFIATGIVTSTCAGMAIGTGIGTIIGLIGPAMGASIFSMLTAQGLVGAKTFQLANAIGSGICISMSLGIVTTVIVGAGFPPTPMTGVDIGKIF